MGEKTGGSMSGISFLDDFLSRLASVADSDVIQAEPLRIFDPEFEVLLGEADISLRRIFVLMARLRSERPFFTTAVMLSGNQSDHEKAEFLARTDCVSESLARAATEIFQASVVVAFPELRDMDAIEHIGMRRRWQVVLIKKPIRSERRFEGRSFSED